MLAERPRARREPTTMILPDIAEAAPETELRGEAWELRLYVTGRSPKCLAAIANLRHACEQHLAGRYQIEIVDLLENPRLAASEQIVAVPTLIRSLPKPERRLLGDLSDSERLLAGLALAPSAGA